MPPAARRFERIRRLLRLGPRALRRAGAPARALHLSRSTPVRQAIVLVAVVALVNLASLGGAFLKMRADLSGAIHEEVLREIESFDVAATPGALATLVGARARATDPAHTVFVFVGDDGQSAGNARALIDGVDLRLAPLAPDSVLSDKGYLHEIRRLSGGVLIVAQSLAPLEDLAETFLRLLAFSLVPTLLVSLGLGALIAQRAARRVEALEATLDRLAQGELAARTGAVAGAARRGDDLARIGAGIDRMAEKQQAATEALRQVSADIAHDLRTPLQRIALLIEDLRAHLAEGSEAADLAGRAAQETERAVAVFRALLEIARIEGGSPSRRFRPIDLAACARQLAELYAPAAEDRGDSLVLDLPEAPLMVRGDAGLVGQALANLLENALTHAPAGSRIALRLARAGTKAVLSVTDDGPGIPEAEREKVLRRLYRLEASRTTPGNGLGLALVAAIAQAHEARLTLGDAGPGLTVTLAFPLAPEASLAQRAV